ncbi:MAG: orotidine 5'-phosphate decarboxylase / HUMPS family protein [Nitrososphaeraceae archaeon]
MGRITCYRERMEYCSDRKNSRIILALDPINCSSLIDYLNDKICLLREEVCAIKFNFHVILPLSLQDMLNVNNTVHSCGLQSIADLKLNDISSTNQIAINHLVNMGFDAVIVNPIIGMNELSKAVGLSHDYNFGVISLVYMSHVGAREGFGLSVINDIETSSQASPLYMRLLEYSNGCDVDGIIVGGTRIDVINSISREKKSPIYSPGLGLQGGDPNEAARSGTDYFIVGRSIIQSKDPLKTARLFKEQTNTIKKG